MRSADSARNQPLAVHIVYGVRDGKERNSSVSLKGPGARLKALPRIAGPPGRACNLVCGSRCNGCASPKPHLMGMKPDFHVRRTVLNQSGRFAPAAVAEISRQSQALPSLSVAEMGLKLYGARYYSQFRRHQFQFALNRA